MPQYAVSVILLEPYRLSDSLYINFGVFKVLYGGQVSISPVIHICVLLELWRTFAILSCKPQNSYSLLHSAVINGYLTTI